MRFGSVCSGIEAASVAWHPLGWKAAWLAEIEPFPCAVLAHHYPDVPNLGDMTALPARILSGEIEAPEVFCGGTPCQAFSAAGLRRSLDDARGNLSLTFCEIADAIDTVRAARGEQPAIIFWENVPGVLSTKDNAFGCFIAALAGGDEPLVPPGKWTDAGAVLGPARAVAWRVLDAQFFGLAQRRRRVFVVASARAGFDPAAVLFEFDGVRRDSPPSREAGEGAPGGTGAGAAVGFQSSQSGVRLVDTHATLDANNGPRRHNGVITMAHGQGGAEIGFDRGPTLNCNHEAPIAAYGIRTANTSSNGWGIQEEATHTLDGAMGIAVAHPVAFHPTQDPISSTDGATHAMGCGSTGGQASVAVAVALRGREGGASEARDSREGTTEQERSGKGWVGETPFAVRRLTVEECELLQGFPRGYSKIPWRKKPASECPDGPRYKALGNSWAVPVVRWIGARIQAALMQAANDNGKQCSEVAA